MVNKASAPFGLSGPKGPNTGKSPIDDITTDTDNPPAFVAVIKLREAEDSNPSTYAGTETAALQKRGYPDLAPLSLALAPDKAFPLALAMLGEEVLGGLLVYQGSLDGLVENDSGAAGEIHLCGDLDRCDMPSAASVDQQRGPARTTGSRATVPQQKPAARIDKAPADAALRIRSQKKRMILLVAAEHHAGPVFRRVI
jgi:hypothetical protein